MDISKYKFYGLAIFSHWQALQKSLIPDGVYPVFETLPGCKKQPWPKIISKYVHLLKYIYIFKLVLFFSICVLHLCSTWHRLGRINFVFIRKGEENGLCETLATLSVIISRSHKFRFYTEG